jgi:hypothetical protein
MDAFAIPLVLFTAGLIWLLVAIIRGSFEDAYPLRAGVTWATTCPTAGLLFGIGLAPIATVLGVVSMLALGSLGYWFLATEPDDDDPASEFVEPDPIPSDDEPFEIPAWARRVEQEPEPEPKGDIDWDLFDRLREGWEKEIAPPATEPERERVPAGV